MSASDAVWNGRFGVVIGGPNVLEILADAPRQVNSTGHGRSLNRARAPGLRPPVPRRNHRRRWFGGPIRVAIIEQGTGTRASPACAPPESSPPVVWLAAQSRDNGSAQSLKLLR